MAMKNWIKISLVVLIVLIILLSLFVMIYRYGIASKLMSKSYKEIEAGNIGYAESLMNLAIKLSPLQIVSFKLGFADVLSRNGYSEDSTRVTASLFSENVDIRGLLYMGDQFFENGEYNLALQAYNESRFSTNSDGLTNLNERAFIDYAKILIMQNKSSEVLPELIRLSTQGVTPLIQNQSTELINSLQK
jgi:hypothetical protein